MGLAGYLDELTRRYRCITVDDGMRAMLADCRTHHGAFLDTSECLAAALPFLKRVVWGTD
jgi:hypothetical protein